VDKTGVSPSESFDALAARLNKRFDELAANLEQMRRTLDAAEEQSERLRQKLLKNGVLRR
jgi:prefoldin subunit 5